MKIKLLLFYFLCFAIIQSEAFPQNVFKDDFNYPPLDSLEGTGGWYRSGVNTIYNIKVVSPGLTYTGYAGSGIGNTSYISNQGEGDVLFHNLSSPVTSGALYLSFMIRLDSLRSTMTQGYCICFNPSTGGTSLNTRLYIKRITGTTFNFGVFKTRNATYSTTVYNSNTTYLVVLKYSFVNGADNDSAKVYVFSSGVPSAEPSVPTAFATDSIDIAGQGSVCLTNNYAQTGMNGCSIKIDGIRIGNSWASSVLSSVNQISTQIPSSINLHQNYPNPFNPETKIVFEISKPGFTTLKIFNVLGNELKKLVNENLSPGSYETEFRPENLTSGIYYYRLESNGVSVTKSMMLIK